jgi:hypothetical protein
MESNHYKILSETSVKDKVEKKGNLQYLSWSHAWHILKTHYPNAQRKVYESEHTGLNYFTDGVTAYVKVGIIVEGLEHIDYLPVMDNRNGSVRIEKVTSRDVNDAIMRSTTKAIAFHGLGLSLWTGEEVSVSSSTQDESPEATEPEEKTLFTLDVGDDNWKRVLAYVVKNKDQGIKALVETLSNKYEISDTTKKELQTAIKDAK